MSFYVEFNPPRWNIDTGTQIARGGGSGGGEISESLKEALLQMAEKVAYIDANGQDYYQDLYDALYPIVADYTISNVLTNVVNSNTSSTISSGGSYTATLSCAQNYEITTVTITMGGNDVTGTAYAGGTISIPNVTGNIVITAVATQRQATLVSISAVFTQGQAVIYTTDSLDALKQYLTVTATYSDSSTQVVTGYTLSGTLTVGTSTITASYGGKTDTFSVTVTQGLPSGYTRYDYVYNNVATNADHVMDTGISGTYCTAEYEHEFTFAVTNNPQSTSYPICGVRTTSGSDPTSRAYWTKSGSSNLACNYYGVDTGFAFTMQTNTKYTTVTSGTTWKVNGTVVRDDMYTENWTPYTSGNMRLWGIQTGTNERAGYTRHTMKVYGYKVKNLTTGEYYSILVPCTNSSNVAGLYDIVLGVFRTANTASTLSAGNDT